MSVAMIRMAGLSLLLMAGPVLAQPAPPASPDAPRYERGMGGDRAGMRRGMRGGMGGGMFAGMSDAGKMVMRDAMRSGADERRGEREAVKAARDRMLTVLEADRLDTAALKRAMEDERKAADASHVRRQTAMFDAYQKLSVEDRKAFVTGARATRERMASRMEEMRERRSEGWRERRQMRQQGGANPTI